jgi:hypothetical protein
MGAKPSGKGYGGCPFTPTKVSLFEKGRPSPTITKAGVEGAQAPSQGAWGMCPQNFKEGASCQLLHTCQEWGPKTLVDPQPTGVGKGGSRGRSLPWQGVWGMSPQNFKEGASYQLLHTRQEWGPKRWRTRSPRGWAKGGPGGEALWRGAWGATHKTKLGASPPRVGPKTQANPQPTGVGNA